jgi:uncharacterized protein YjbJ (UPF0337 family)
MINQTTLKGNWNEIKGKLRSRWGQLTNDDVQNFNGNVDQLVGLIERKTGETRTAVEDFLNELTARGSASIGGAVEDARVYVQDAAQRIQDGSRQAMDSLRDNYQEAEELVRRNPRESAAICFGIGCFVGLLFGLSMRKH